MWKKIDAWLLLKKTRAAFFSDRPGRRVDTFIVISLIFHLALLFVFSLITIKNAKEEKAPLVVEFTEDENRPNLEFNDFPQKNETEEPAETNRLSDKNRKVEEETVKLGSPLGGEISRPNIFESRSPIPMPSERKPEENDSKKEDYIARTDEKSPRSPTEDTMTPSLNDGGRLGIEDIMPSPNGLGSLNQPFGTISPNVKVGETVSLNTQEFKYYSYFSHLKRKIEMAWNYPLKAQENNWGGRLNIVFTIEKNGNVSSIKLVKSSGYEILDDAAISALKYASPFNPIPESIGEDRLRISASFEYITSLFGVKW